MSMKAARARYGEGWEDLTPVQRKQLKLAEGSSEGSAERGDGGAGDVFTRLSSPDRQPPPRRRRALEAAAQENAARRLRSPAKRLGSPAQRLGSPPRTAEHGAQGDVFTRLSSPQRDGQRRSARLRSPDASAARRVGSPQRSGRRSERLTNPTRRELASPARTPRPSAGGGDGRIPGREVRERLFRRLDEEGHGFLSLAQIGVAVSELLPRINNRPALQAAYKAADVKSDGWIGRREFRQLLCHLVFFDERWDRFESIETGDDMRLSPPQFCAACAHVGCPMQPADAAIAFTQLDPAGSGYVLAEIFRTWCARNPDKQTALPPKAATPPGAARPGAAPSLNEIEELESVYAQFVNTAPTTASIKLQPPQPGVAAGASLAAISDGGLGGGANSPGSQTVGQGGVGAWDTGGSDDIDALLRRESSTKASTGTKRSVRDGRSQREPRSPRMASPPPSRAWSHAPSRLVRSMVSPPRRTQRATSYRGPATPMGGQPSLLSHSRTTHRHLVSPPRGGRSSVGGGQQQQRQRQPVWSGNSKQFHRVERAARTLWDDSSTGLSLTLQEKKARSQNAVAKAIEANLREWHPAYTGSSSVHDTLHGLHSKAQQRKDELREQVQRARELKEAAECRPWDEDRRRRAQSQGRPRFDGLDLPTRTLQWQKARDAAIQDKRAIVTASSVPRRQKPAAMTAEQLHESIARMHKEHEEKAERIKRKAQDKQEKETPDFRPGLNPHSRRLAANRNLGSGGDSSSGSRPPQSIELRLLELGQRRREQMEHRRQAQEEEEKAGLFSPLTNSTLINGKPIAPRQLLSPERVRDQLARAQTPRRTAASKDSAHRAALFEGKPTPVAAVLSARPSAKARARAIAVQMQSLQPEQPHPEQPHPEQPQQRPKAVARPVRAAGEGAPATVATESSALSSVPAGAAVSPQPANGSAGGEGNQQATVADTAPEPEPDSNASALHPIEAIAEGEATLNAAAAEAEAEAATAAADETMGDRIDEALEPGCSDLAAMQTLLREVQEAGFHHASVASLEIKCSALEEKAAAAEVEKQVQARVEEEAAAAAAQPATEEEEVPVSAGEKWPVGSITEIETEDGKELAVILGPAIEGSAAERRVRFIDGVEDDWDVSDFIEPPWQTGTEVDIETEEGLEKGAVIIGLPKSRLSTELRVKFADGTIEDWETEDFLAHSAVAKKEAETATAKEAAEEAAAKQQKYHSSSLFLRGRRENKTSAEPNATKTASSLDAVRSAEADLAELMSLAEASSPPAAQGVASNAAAASTGAAADDDDELLRMMEEFSNIGTSLEADPVALAKSTQPAEQAIDAAAVSATKELTDHMKGGLQLSGEFAEIGGQHMFDLKQGACSIKSVGKKKWADLRETARMGISKQT